MKMIVQNGTYIYIILFIKKECSFNFWLIFNLVSRQLVELSENRFFCIFLPLSLAVHSDQRLSIHKKKKRYLIKVKDQIEKQNVLYCFLLKYPFITQCTQDLRPYCLQVTFFFLHFFRFIYLKFIIKYQCKTALKYLR